MKPKVTIDTIIFIRVLDKERIQGKDIAEYLELSKQTVSVYLNFDSFRDYRNARGIVPQPRVKDLSPRTIDLNRLAMNRGFGSHYTYQKFLVMQKGYTSYYDYQQSLPSRKKMRKHQLELKF